MMRLNGQIWDLTALARLPRWFYQVALVVGVCLCSLVIGVAAARGSTMLILAILAPPLGLVALAALIRYFDLFVLVFPVTALALRFAVLPTGSASVLPLSLVLSLGLIAIWGFSMFTRRSWQLPETCVRLPLLLFAIVMIVSLPWGILWRDPVLNMSLMGSSFIVTQVGSLASLVVSIGVPFLVGRFIDQPWKVRFYLGCFVVFGALMTFSQFFGVSQNVLNDRGLWGLWHVGVMFGLLITLPGLRPWQRALLVALIALNLYQTILRNALWISGWLPTVIGIVAITFFHSRRIFLITMAVVLLGTAVGPGRAYIDQVAEDNVQEGGLERLSLWERSLSLVHQHWLLGMGPAGYAPYNMTYYRDDARSTHNNYFDILAQFGVVGLGLWLVVMGAIMREGWRTVRAAPHGLLRTTAIIAAGGWVAALASMMLGDWILPFAYNQGIGGYGYTVFSWIFLGLLISVRRMTVEAAARPPATAYP